MKKECNLLNICHPSTCPVTNAGDWSPHRSTVEPKEWVSSHPEITDELAFGEPDSFPRQLLSLQIQQGQCTSYPAIILPRFQDVPVSQEKQLRAEYRVRCVSNDSLTDAWGPVSEPLDDLVPMTRQVSLELQMETESFTDETTVQQQPETRCKRRRNSSIDEDISPMEEEEDLYSSMSNRCKRRRLHDRKRAMDNQDFSAILAQIGM